MKIDAGKDGPPVGIVPGAIAGKGEEPPGRKLNLYVRYWPESGAFALQMFDGGSLSPVIYEGAHSGDIPRPMGDNRRELMAMAEKVMMAVLYGIRNDPDRAGIMPVSPSVLEAIQKYYPSGEKK